MSNVYRQPNGTEAALFRRYRSQSGALIKSGGKRNPEKWFGRWRKYWVDESGHRRDRQFMVFLGFASQMSEQRARESLRDYINSQELAYHYSADGAPGEAVRDEALKNKIKIGAASELRVSCDLLLRGFEVFRSVSHTASCDLIALRDGQVFRVEVKTGHAGKGGEIIYGRPALGAFDLLAVVHPNGLVDYQVSSAENAGRIAEFSASFKNAPRIYDFLETQGTRSKRSRDNNLEHSGEATENPECS